ncbi:hypothetical protein NDU88_000864 [Pleurodeles waltl]|uniref:Uncharacterized protein n=1 Tax=Pleurodeles waltl TaxID=8319 RepID=A0AAV7S6W7_PLEWA|nr:hypothetical protein NDU88_000864 [Pleurodeles waltl]
MTAGARTSTQTGSIKEACSVLQDRQDGTSANIMWSNTEVLLVSGVFTIMALYDVFEGDMEQYQEDPEGSFEQELVDALDSSVQQSMYKARTMALGPITLHLKGFTR